MPCNAKGQRGEGGGAVNIVGRARRRWKRERGQVGVGQRMLNLKKRGGASKGNSGEEESVKQK